MSDYGLNGSVSKCTNYGLNGCLFSVLFTDSMAGCLNALITD